MLWTFYSEDKNFLNKLLFLSLLILPFQTFLGILILVYISYQASVKNWSQIKNSSLTLGFIFLSLLLIVSSIFAYKSGEAWLGIVHFLPFFWVFLSLRTIVKTYEQLYTIVWSLILSSIIVVLIAIGEINFHWVTIDIIYKLFGWQLTGEGIPRKGIFCFSLRKSVSFIFSYYHYFINWITDKKIVKNTGWIKLIYA